MPVGTPKVPFGFNDGDGNSDNDNSSWVEVYHRLFHERMLFLGQEVNKETSNHIVGMMVYLSLQDPDKDIHLFINSPGGDVISGMAIYDTMQVVEANVCTTVVGVAASMASLILLGGQMTERLAFPHASIMMHQPKSVYFDEQSGTSLLEGDGILNMRQTMVDIYVQRTGKPAWQVSADLDRDFFMSPEEAKDYGIIDIIADSNAKWSAYRNKKS